MTDTPHYTLDEYLRLSESQTQLSNYIAGEKYDCIKENPQI